MKICSALMRLQSKFQEGKKKQLFNIKPLLMSVWVNYKKISKICTFYSEVNNTVCAAWLRFFLFQGSAVHITDVFWSASKEA